MYCNKQMLFEIMEQEQIKTVENVTDKSPSVTEKNNVNNQLVQTYNNGLSAINLFDEKQLIAAENFITKVMRSDKGGIKNAVADICLSCYKSCFIRN